MDGAILFSLLTPVVSPMLPGPVGGMKGEDGSSYQPAQPQASSFGHRDHPYSLRYGSGVAGRVRSGKNGAW